MTMPARIALMPPILKPGLGTAALLRCDLGFLDQHQGANARLIIYEADSYLRTAAGLAERTNDDRLAGFTSDTFTLPKDARDPVIESGSGVLLKLDGAPRKTKSGKWFFEISRKQQADDAGPKIRLQLAQADDRVLQVAELPFRQAGNSCASTSGLVVRIALVDSGEVIASSLNPRQSAGASPIVLCLDVPQEPSLSGIGDVVEAGAPRESAGAAPEQRVVTPDLTGFYEAIPNEANKSSPLLLQLHQAGKVLVGWFTPPPSFVPDVDRLYSRIPKTGQNQVNMEPGVLVAYLDLHSERGFNMTWMEQPPNRPFNQIDPDHLIAQITQQSTAVKGEALLRVIVEKDTNFFRELRIKFDGNAVVEDRFVRVKAGARWSWFHAQGLPQDLQKMVIAEQIRPVPSSFYAAIRPIVASSSGKPAKIIKHLEVWRSAGKIDKIQKRGDISLLVSDIFGTGMANPNNDVYREGIATRMRSYAATEILLIDKERKSVLEWLQEVMAEELDFLKEKGQTTSNVRQRFEKVGIRPQGEFRYTLDFYKLGGGPPQVIVKLGFWGFLLDIKKERLEFERDSLGAVKKTSDGQPIVKKATVIYDSSTNLTHKYGGFFVDIGAGLGFDGKVGIKGSKALVGTAVFTSYSDLKLEDFDGADFSIAMAKGPTFSFGVAVTLELSSAYVEFRLTNGVVLHTVVEKSLKDVQPLKMPGIDEFKKKVAEPKFEVKLFELSVGWGKLVLNTNPYVAADHPRPPLDKNNQHDLFRWTASFFKVDSADIDTVLYIASTRSYLEVLLAIDRALFEVGNARVRAYGYASPEHTEKHNLDLSKRRAEAIIQATKDAFGSTLAVDVLTSEGLGEKPARDAGLLDPPDPPMPRAQWQKQHADQVKQWPDWRRVDLVIEGQVVARIRTEQP